MLEAGKNDVDIDERLGCHARYGRAADVIVGERLRQQGQQSVADALEGLRPLRIVRHEFNRAVRYHFHPAGVLDALRRLYRFEICA
ncbi:hypothetical protein GGE48_001047 [Rhizobium leguminosarum]|nr:hypothetical protein [Rhizobium leguminosarum]